jgi:hypothetical protein
VELEIILLSEINQSGDIFFSYVESNSNMIIRNELFGEGTTVGRSDQKGAGW